MKRGEVRWIELAPPAGRRPAVRLSRDSAYRVRASATVAPITRTIRHILVEVELIEVMKPVDEIVKPAMEQKK